jgi:hypothetical protein
VGKGVEILIIENLDPGSTYAFTVKLVDIDGNKSLGSLIIVTMARRVTDLDLAQYITAPVAGATPDTRAFVGTQYTGTVYWRPSVGAMSPSDPFVEGTVYVVQVTLKANPGYTFAGLGSSSFTCGESIDVLTRDDGVINIHFPALGKAWYVADYGNDTTGNGLTRTTAVNSVNKALALIENAHKSINGGPLTSATIVVIGTSGDRGTVKINNTGAIYPPITLRGLGPTQPGILTADKVPTTDWNNPTATNSYRVLEVAYGAEVTLGNDLTITGGGKRGDVDTGAGVYVHHDGSFTMNGGTIMGNKSTTSGGAIHVRYEGSSFIMNGGTISDNTSPRSAVNIQTASSMSMTGGTISDNTSDFDGGAVRVSADNSTFDMSGGAISDNTANWGAGGVFVGTGGSFTMSGGAITGNDAMKSGGAVDIERNGTFTMTGGTIAGNTTEEYGGGVSILNVGETGTASFTMRGGTIAGNTAALGGGGVALGEAAGTFIKAPLVEGEASGIIYGNDAGDNSNKATLGETSLLNNKGHAVYIAPEANGPKTRETTAGQGDLLDSTADGGWTE